MKDALEMATSPIWVKCVSTVNICAQNIDNVLPDPIAMLTSAELRACKRCYFRAEIRLIIMTYRCIVNAVSNHGHNASFVEPACADPTPPTVGSSLHSHLLKPLYLLGLRSKSQCVRSRPCESI